MISDITGGEFTGRGARPRLRKRRGRQAKAVDPAPVSRGKLLRTKKLILAAVRVWELKRGMRE
jgi:hypothetical protein